MTVLPGIAATIHPINLGGNTFGWTADRDVSFAVLDAFTAAGGNFVDTADMYSAWVPGNAGGESERILGAWMAERGNRDAVVVATKAGALPTRRGLTRENVEAALGDSLERLGTDRVELFYAHYDDESVAIADQVETFTALVESGRVGAVALSNHSPARMREWFETAHRLGGAVPVAIQPKYSLVERAGFERDYAPLAAEFGAAVFSYSSLASGFLTGSYRATADAEGRPRGGAVATYLTPEGFGVVAALDDVAAARGVEVSSVALSWLRARGVAAPIASASRVDQVAALVAGATLELSGDEIAMLDEASAPFA